MAMAGNCSLGGGFGMLCGVDCCEIFNDIDISVCYRVFTAL